MLQRTKGEERKKPRLQKAERHDKTIECNDSITKYRKRLLQHCKYQQIKCVFNKKKICEDIPKPNYFIILYASSY